MPRAQRHSNKYRIRGPLRHSANLADWSSATNHKIAFIKAASRGRHLVGTVKCGTKYPRSIRTRGDRLLQPVNYLPNPDKPGAIQPASRPHPARECDSASQLGLGEGRLACSSLEKTKKPKHQLSSKLDYNSAPGADSHHILHCDPLPRHRRHAKQGGHLATHGPTATKLVTSVPCAKADSKLHHTQGSSPPGHPLVAQSTAVVDGQALVTKSPFCTNRLSEIRSGHGRTGCYGPTSVVCHQLKHTNGG